MLIGNMAMALSTLEGKRILHDVCGEDFRNGLSKTNSMRLREGRLIEFLVENNAVLSYAMLREMRAYITSAMLSFRASNPEETDDCQQILKELSQGVEL